MPPVAPSLLSIATANREAFARLVDADPVLVDCVSAGEAIGLGERAGTGQVGAGTVRAPLGRFTAALEALARSRGVA